MTEDDGISRDVKMLQTPDDWPRWPLLPLTRKDEEGHVQIGFMIHAAPILTTVFLGNIYCAKSAFEDAVNWEGEGVNPHKIDYRNVDEIVQDGWHVD